MLPLTLTTLMLISATFGTKNTGHQSAGGDVLSEHHFQRPELTSHEHKGVLFMSQNEADHSLGVANFQIDLASELPANNQDQALNSHDQHHDPSADYYYPDLASNHIANNQSPSQETFEPPLLSNFNNPRLPEKEYLSHHLADKACRLDRGCQRKDRLNNTYLSYCTRYKLENLFSNEILMSIMHDSVEECDKILDEFIQLDELINQFDQLFKKLLTRYNCHNGYSVKWSCEDCKKAYKDWLCATNLPYYMNGERIKPCISFCERVEQRCPYLHPITKEQYGGQPVFICRDPNIPFVPEITPDIPYSEPTKCYDLCHISDNTTELLIDSLSKYDPDKCPSKGSIAEEVRSDPLYCRLDLEQQSVNQSKTHHRTNSFDVNSLAEYPTDVDDTTLSSFNGSVTEHKPVSATKVHVHIKKLEELKEVFKVNDRSIDHSKHWSTPRSHRSLDRARRQVEISLGKQDHLESYASTAKVNQRCDRCFAQ